VAFTQLSIHIDRAIACASGGSRRDSFQFLCESGVGLVHPDKRLELRNKYSIIGFLSTPSLFLACPHGYYLTLHPHYIVRMKAIAPALDDLSKATQILNEIICKYQSSVLIVVFRCQMSPR
jgi:hypothetical protein